MKLGIEDGMPLLLPALLFMTLIVLAPLLYVLYFSVTDDGVFTLAGFESAAQSTLLGRVMMNTVVISASAAVIAVVIAYPIALHIASVTPTVRGYYLALVMLPFWTSILVKSYAFAVILGRDGFLNQALRAVFGPQAHAELLYNRVGVLIGTLNYVMPFVVLPILSNLLSQDPNLARAARVMGAGPIRILARITLPLSVRAAVVGGLMAMIISFGSFILPSLLGGRKDAMLANLIDIYTREILDWQTSSVIALILLAMSAAMLITLFKLEARGQG